jgi:hypothetical protein
MNYNKEMFDGLDNIIRNHLIVVLIIEYICLTILISTFTEWYNGNITLWPSIQLDVKLREMKIVSIRTFKNLLMSILCIGMMITTLVFILASMLFIVLLIIATISVIFSLIIK